MKPQFENVLMSSMYLWLDNLILTKGEAFSNVNSSFYKINNNVNGLYAYAAPYKSIVSDVSITGATQLSGVYLNSTFIQRGVSGFTGINYEQGQLYFTSPLPNSANLTGSYAIKEFNVSLTDKPDSKILYNTKYYHKNNIAQNPSGLPSEAEVYPTIYIKNEGGKNDEWAFGGLETTKNYLKLVVLADSEFSLSAVKSIVKDRIRTMIPLVNYSEMPFNSLGDYCNTGSRYNYPVLTTGRFQSSNSVSLEDVTVLTPSSDLYDAIRMQNANIFVSMIELEVVGYRMPRSA